MKSEIKIVIPGPPVAWQRTGGSGNRRFKKPQTRAYEELIAWHARIAMGWKAPFTGPIELVVTSYFPFRKSWSRKKLEAAKSGAMRPTVKPDWDNLGKITDALNNLVWEDDKQVVYGLVIKYYDREPRLEIVVKQIDIEKGEESCT